MGLRERKGRERARVREGKAFLALPGCTGRTNASAAVHTHWWCYAAIVHDDVVVKHACLRSFQKGKVRRHTRESFVCIDGGGCE